MSDNTWARELPAAITICDTDGIIIEMNKTAARSFEKEGGGALLGSNVLDCHPEPSRTRLQELLREGKANCYTISKGEIRKFIYQTPWFRDGRYAGILELSFEIPDQIPHFNRA